jgi:hypothetical protein
MSFLHKQEIQAPQTPVSSTNKTDRHDITEIFLKVAFNTIALIEAPPSQISKWYIKGYSNKSDSATSTISDVVEMKKGDRVFVKHTTSSIPFNVNGFFFKAATKAGLMRVSETNKPQSIHVNRNELLDPMT